MRYRQLTQPNNDFAFGGGSAEFLVDSPAAVRQAIQTALNLLQGESFTNIQAGMPWQTQVLGYGTQSLYDSAIKNCILGIQGVVNGVQTNLVTSFASYSSSLNAVTRVLTVNAIVNTVFGQATLATTVPVYGFGVGPFGQFAFGT